MADTKAKSRSKSKSKDAAPEAAPAKNGGARDAWDEFADDGDGSPADLRPHEIDTFRLQEEYSRLPADVAWANGQVADAQREYLMAKHEFEEVEARMYMICRERLEGAGKKVTEAMIKSQIVDDQEYIDARVRKVEAEANLSRLKGEAEALRAKRDMLIQIGAHVRAEMDSDPVIRRQHAERRGAAVG